MLDKHSRLTKLLSQFISFSQKEKNLKELIDWKGITLNQFIPLIIFNHNNFEIID